MNPNELLKEKALTADWSGRRCDCGRGMPHMAELCMSTEDALLIASLGDEGIGGTAEVPIDRSRKERVVYDTARAITSDLRGTVA